MDMNNVNIEEIVKQVLAGMAGTAPAASASAAPVAPAAAPAGAIPKTAHVAVLTEKEHFDIKEYPIPALGDDDILVKVEGGEKPREEKEKRKERELVNVARDIFGRQVMVILKCLDE